MSICTHTANKESHLGKIYCENLFSSTFKSFSFDFVFSFSSVLWLHEHDDKQEIVLMTMTDERQTFAFAPQEKRQSLIGLLSSDRPSRKSCFTRGLFTSRRSREWFVSPTSWTTTCSPCGPWKRSRSPTPTSPSRRSSEPPPAKCWYEENVRFPW